MILQALLERWHLNKNLKMVNKSKEREIPSEFYDTGISPECSRNIKEAQIARVEGCKEMKW